MTSSPETPELNADLQGTVVPANPEMRHAAKYSAALLSVIAAAVITALKLLTGVLTGSCIMFIMHWI